MHFCVILSLVFSVSKREPQKLVDSLFLGRQRAFSPTVSLL